MDRLLPAFGLYREPGYQKHNLGIYRMQVYDAQTTGLHWQIQKGGGFHYTEAERLGQSLPVTCISWWATGFNPGRDCAFTRGRSRAGAGIVARGPKVETDKKSTGGSQRTSVGGRGGVCVGEAMRLRTSAALKDHSAITTATTPCNMTIPCLRLTRFFIAATLSIRPPLWASRGRKIFYRRLFAAVAVATVSAGNARGARSLDVWRNWFSLPVCGGGQGTLRS